MKIRAAILPALIFAGALGLRLWMLHSYGPLGPWVAAQTLADAEMGRNLLAGRGWIANAQMIAKANAANAARNEMADLEDLLPVNDGAPDSITDVGSASSPGYSVWFAISYWIGGAARYRYSQIMQATLDAFGCVLLFAIGRAIWSRGAGLIAAALYALWPAPAFLANLTVAAATDTFWFIAVVYGAVTAWRQIQAGVTPWRGVAVVVLAAFGGACMNSTSFVLPAAVAGMSLLAILVDRRAWRLCAYMIVAQILVALLLTPWAFRNQRRYGEFSPVRGSFWQLAFAAFGELPNPWGLGFEDKYYWNWVAENCPSCNSGDRERLARDYILGTVVMSAEFPRHAWNLIVRRLPTLLDVSRLPQGRYNPGDSPRTQAMLKWIMETADAAVPALFVLSGIGLMIGLWSPAARVTMIIAMAPTIFLTIFSLLFYAELRKTVPGFGFMVVPAGIALVSIAGALRAGVARIWR